MSHRTKNTIGNENLNTYTEEVPVEFLRGVGQYDYNLWKNSVTAENTALAYIIVEVPSL